jgi:NADH:ubiquinone oxidoreductase subunit C
MKLSTVNLLKSLLKDKIQELIVQRERRIFLLIEQQQLKETIRQLVGQQGFSHLSTITGVDIGSYIELIYHFVFKDTLVSLKVRISKENLFLPTIVDLTPVATFYERELHDLFGVEFEGHLDLSPLLLPDDWPNDIFPLRKEWTLEKISKVMKGHDNAS